VGVGSFLFVTMDCHDPELLASFWAKVLGTEPDLVMDDGRYVFLKGGDDLPVICFQRVPEDKTVKNRMHLDVSVDDLDAATATVLALGGSWPDGIDHRLEDVAWRTLADPEGNEFDLALG
jgi:predicted enzyme related to lactoylglutathione lyase